LRVIVQPEKLELTPAEARLKYHVDDEPSAWLTPPHDVSVMNRLPCLPPGSLVNSYADWFAGVRALLPSL